THGRASPLYGFDLEAARAFAALPEIEHRRIGGLVVGFDRLLYRLRHVRVPRCRRQIVAMMAPVRKPKDWGKAGHTAAGSASPQAYRGGAMALACSYAIVFEPTSLAQWCRPMSDGFESLFITAHDGLKLHVRAYGPRGAARLPVMCLPGLARTS